MIEVINLTKKFGDFTAVDEISFQVKKGDILGILGPNGAGKSTTMKILTCFLSPTSGTAKIGGKDIISDSIEVRKQIGYLPESAPSYKDMTVEEFLRFIGEVRGFLKKENRKKVEDIMKTTFLTDVRHQTIDTLSKGYRQRVGFAQALIHDPPVLILDEPTDGLDPNQKNEVRKLIKNISKEKAIILSTHILEEMEAVCNRAIIINQGKIVIDTTPTELLKKSSTFNVVTIGFSALPEDAKSILENSTQISHVTQLDSNILQVFPNNNENILPIIQKIIQEKQWAIEELHKEKGRLDEVFREITLGDQ